MPFVPDNPAPSAGSRFVPDAPVAPAAAAGPADRLEVGQAEPDAPKGYYYVTMDDGHKELRKGFGAMDAVSAFPGTGLAELATQGVTSLASKAASGFMGMFGAGVDHGDAAPEVIKDVQDRFTYQPKSQAATDIGDVLGKVAGVFEPAGNAVEAGLDKMGPGAVTLGNALGEAVLDVAPLAASLRPVSAAMRARPPKIAPEPPPAMSPVVAQAREMNVRLRPSDVQAASPGSKVPGTFAEKLNDPSDLKKDLIRNNQQKFTQLAGEDIGVGNVSRLSNAEFETAKAPHVKTYEAAETALNRVPLPEDFKVLYGEAAARAKFKEGTTPTVTRTIGALRRRASKQIQSQDVATQEAGYADQAMAKRLEDAFGDRLKSLGDEKLFKDYQGARKAFAKIHNVETATRAGQVDAQVLNRQMKKGAPLTGRLKMIAEAAENFPHVTSHSLRSAAGGLPKVDTVTGQIKDFLAAAVRKTPGLQGRLNVRSDAFQNRLGMPADPARRSYFDTYGEKPKSSPARPVPAPQLGTEDVPFAPAGRPLPPLATELAGDLGLVPDEVMNPDIASIVLSNEPSLADLLLGHEAELPPALRFRTDRVAGGRIIDYGKKK